MTKTERKAIALVLAKVLKRMPATSNYIPYCNSAFICDNVYEAATDDHIADLITDVIKERTTYCFSLESWLKHQSLEIADQVRYDRDNNKGRKMQAYRKAWLRELIKEFEA